MEHDTQVNEENTLLICQLKKGGKKAITIETHPIDAKIYLHFLRRKTNG